MGARYLARWEEILRSDVAVALLLLAGIVVIAGGLLRWIRRLYDENRALHREFRAHLEADATLRRAVDEWAIEQLIQRHEKEEDDG